LSPNEQKTANLWYKDAVIYELHVKSFYDSNGDGIGDFQGLVQKLDYLRELGVTAIWLLPFYPSPLLDDGYDIADYRKINPDFGTLRDFQQFLRAAHARGIRVITELVINHTSDQHRWFQRARRARPGSIRRDYYVWSDTPDKYNEARIIFNDFESSNWAWDPAAQAYYWHRFYSHQPDLNYDNPRVRKEIFRVVDFWFGMGVDGLRLDAVPYLFERDGTNCENLPETHTFLKELRAHIDGKFSDRMLLAEANQWPEDAAAYFGNGDECHMAFNFPVMPRLFMALRMEDRFPIIDMLEQSLDIPDTCQWAMFLRNHDELTLEMVTDEERDYMYRAYAQDPRARINLGIRRRLSQLLNNNRRTIELMNILLFSLPGTPVIYYGDEIGMGDNYYLGDRDGVRTPMQWSPDRNAGFSRANPHMLYLPVVIDPEYHYTAVNVENQSRNLSSLLWFMRRVIAMRQRFKAFGQGSIEFVASDNPKVLTFLRKHGDETMLVVANLSRFCQVTHIRLPEFAGFSVEEAFSGNTFGEVTQQPYTLSLAPHHFFWFLLSKQTEPAIQAAEEITHLKCDTRWDSIPATDYKHQLTDVIRRYIRKCRWFGGKGKTLRRLSIVDGLSLPTSSGTVHLLLVKAYYTGASNELYFLPLSFAMGELELRVMKEYPQSVIAHIELQEGQGIIYESVYDEHFRNTLLALISGRRRRKSGERQLIGVRGRTFREFLPDKSLPTQSQVLQAEQSNTSVIYENTFFLKLYRRLDEGTNPDVELSSYLTQKTQFANFPAYAGSLQWHREHCKPITLGLLLAFVRNEGDAWTYTLDTVGRYFNQVLAFKDRIAQQPELPDSVLNIDLESIPPLLVDSISPLYLEMVGLLGQRTAELHLALASLSHHPDVQPEPFSMLYQKSVYQSMRGLTLKVFSELEDTLNNLPEDIVEHAKQLIPAKRTILSRLRRIIEKKISALKIRIHGDYHLGQVLFTGKDFVIIDFEGEPARSMSERRLKRSALRDVAGMTRSFHYAAHGALLLRAAEWGANTDYLEHWADLWYFYVSGVFLRSYMHTVADAGLLPQDSNDFEILFESFLLEKAVYELGYELNNRPSWLMIPIRGIQHILKGNI